LDLNLFDNRKINNDFTNKFIEELKNALKNMMNEGRNMNETNNELDEYNLYEKKKIFLDNKSRSGNKLAWVMDDNSVCISEHGDGGPYFISETDLPKNVKVGEVYENIDGKYVYNSTITEEIKEIEK
jgi:hypothetical protein